LAENFDNFSLMERMCPACRTRLDQTKAERPFAWCQTCRRVVAAYPANRPRDEDWRKRAACRGVDILLFYGPSFSSARRARAYYQAANRICGPCSVRAECAEDWLSLPGHLRDFGFRVGRIPAHLERARTLAETAGTLIATASADGASS